MRTSITLTRTAGMDPSENTGALAGLGCAESSQGTFGSSTLNSQEPLEPLEPLNSQDTKDVEEPQAPQDTEVGEEIGGESTESLRGNR